MKKKNAPAHLKVDNDSRKKRLNALWWISGTVFVLAVAGLVLYFVMQWHDRQAYDDIAEVTPTPFVTPTAPPTPVNSPTPQPATATPEPTPEPIDLPVDFDYLKSINEDIVGWVVVEGTDIDYAILYDENEYYLNHNYRGDYSYSGSIFMQSLNSPDFTDFNSVLYGHNMGSGTMFAQLHRFEKESFFDEHDTIIIYKPSYKLTYRIFAAYRTDNRHILNNFSFDTKEAREAYIDHVFDHSYANYDLDVPVEESDRIITLSTCIGNPDYRYLVQGVLISEEYGVFNG